MIVSALDLESQRNRGSLELERMKIIDVTKDEMFKSSRIGLCVVFQERRAIFLRNHSW